MAKIKIHNIFHTSGQHLLTFPFSPEKADHLPSILYALREEGISLPFIGQSMDRDGNFSLCLAIAQEDLEWVKAAFQEGLDLPSPPAPEMSKPVAVITLYGPHLGEIPGIASSMIQALAVDGIEVSALSASINSCLLVTPQPFLPKALHSLDRVFTIPQK